MTCRGAPKRTSSTTRRRSRSWRSSARRSSTCWRRSSRRRRIAATRRARARPTSARAAVAAPTSPGRRRRIPTTGIIFIASTSGCSPTLLAPATERDNAAMTGKTVAHWARRAAASRRRRRWRTIRWPASRDLFKGPLGRIVAIDMNTGEHLWTIPHGDTARRRRRRSGQPAPARASPRHQLGSPRTRGDGRALDAAACDGPDRRQPASSCSRIDKKTGKRVAGADQRLGGYGLMTYLHQGKQYIVVPKNGGYTTFSLP